MRVKSILLGTLVGLATGMSVASAEYPDKPITFLIAFGAGGGTDIAVRTYAPYMEKCLGNGATIVPLNRPGASGQIGFAELANSEPDGYMISTLNAPNVEVGAITGSSYTLDQFEILGNIVGTNVTLIVSKDSEIKTLDDLVKAAKSAEPPMNFGTSSLAADDHLAALRFASMAGFKFTTLPLESAGNVRNAIIGGHVTLGSLSNSETAPFMDQLTVLALAAPERSPLMPDVPTFRELGYDLVAGSNHIIATKAGVPDDVRDKLAGCVASVAADPEFIAEAKERSISLNVMSAEEAKEFVAKEEADLRKLWETDPWTK